MFCVPRWAGKKALSLLMMYNKSNKCTHFRTETKRERKTQSRGRYTNTRRGVESEQGGFWFASRKVNEYFGGIQ